MLKSEIKEDYAEDVLKFKTYKNWKQTDNRISSQSTEITIILSDIDGTEVTDINF